ncbi:hypothetical protein ACLOJK_030423 [Asimina triloba]
MERGMCVLRSFRTGTAPACLTCFNALCAKFIGFVNGECSRVYPIAAAIQRCKSAGISSTVVCLNQHWCQHRCLSATRQPKISWGVSSCETLLSKLEIALKDHCLDEAWGIFTDFKNLYGFPKQCVVRRLIIEMCYASDPGWLEKAHDLVLLILKRRSDLLHHDFLTRLVVALARAQMPSPASTVVRIMLEKEKILPMDMLSTVLLHMVKTSTGTYLASDALIEICDCCLRSGDRNTRSSRWQKLHTPNTMIFNLVLDACVRFGATLKAQQIIEDVMPRMGVMADAGTIVIMALIHEGNGLRDELKKLKEHVDSTPVLLDQHYKKFYDSFLSLHFKFNDIDAAAGLVLDLYRRRQSLHQLGALAKKDHDLERPCLVHIGSCNFRNGLKMKIKPELLQHDFTVGGERQPEHVLFMDGKLVASQKALAKIIHGYIRERNVSHLSNLLISIEKVLDFPSDASLSSDVVNACIQLGWLEIAHDILDDMYSAAAPVGQTTYMSLLKAYCKGNQLDEAKVLLKQMRNVGLLLDSSDEKVITACHAEDDPISPPHAKATPGLAEFLLQETREEGSPSGPTPLVYEMNSSIYFFCKAKMMEDALKTLQKMREMNLQPLVQTFSNLVNGYSSLHMYREITILWGEIRRRMDDGVLPTNRDLLESLLWNFIRGGYFERVMEIIGYMNKHRMHADRWKYRREFLKFHKDLYRNLRTLKAKTEAQSNRVEHVRAFRKWAGINLRD